MPLLYENGRTDGGGEGRWKKGDTKIIRAANYGTRWKISWKIYKVKKKKKRSYNIWEESIKIRARRERKKK